jgi:hypothetical protein
VGSQASHPAFATNRKLIMNITNPLNDRHSESQPELGFGPEPAARSEEPPGVKVDLAPPRPRRKYPRKAKPRLQETLQEPGLAPGCNGHLQEAAPTLQASQTDPADEWDLDSLRVSQDYADGLGVEQAVTDVPVCKPAKSQWVRTHPGLDYRIETLLLELEEERELYLISPQLHSALITEPMVSRRLLITSITRQGRLFLWPVKLPAPDGKSNIWSETAMEAARRASSAWVRIAADLSFGTYRVWEAKAVLDEPRWPNLTFKEILRLAFQERRISSPDHPIVKRLQEGG